MTMAIGNKRMILDMITPHSRIIEASAGIQARINCEPFPSIAHSLTYCEHRANERQYK